MLLQPNPIFVDRESLNENSIFNQKFDAVKMNIDANEKWQTLFHRLLLKIIYGSDRNSAELINEYFAIFWARAYFMLLDKVNARRRGQHEYGLCTYLRFTVACDYQYIFWITSYSSISKWNVFHSHDFAIYESHRERKQLKRVREPENERYFPFDANQY